MGNKHQENWMDYLPLVILGKNTSLQPDIGASPSELSLGLNVRIPGQLLSDPGEAESAADLKLLLSDIRNKTNVPVSQPSHHTSKEKPLPGIPKDATHAYTKQHQTTGLQPSYEGPFLIKKVLSRSTVQLVVGEYRDGSERFEVRHVNDLKFAHPDSLAAPASRPTLGRPRTSDHQKTPNQTDVPYVHVGFGKKKNSSNQSSSDQAAESKQNGKLGSNSHETSIPDNRVPASADNNGSPITGPPPEPAFRSRPSRSTRNPDPKYIDAVWSASEADLEHINNSISNKSAGPKPAAA